LAIFDRNPLLSQKQYEIGPWLLWITKRKSKVADRSVSVPMTLSHLEMRDAGSKVFFLADLRNYARMVCHRMTKFGMVTQVGRSVFLGVRHAPY